MLIYCSIFLASIKLLLFFYGERKYGTDRLNGLSQTFYVTLSWSFQLEYRNDILQTHLLARVCMNFFQQETHLELEAEESRNQFLGFGHSSGNTAMQVQTEVWLLKAGSAGTCIKQEGRPMKVAQPKEPSAIVARRAGYEKARNDSGFLLLFSCDSPHILSSLFPTTLVLSVIFKSNFFLLEML